MTLEHAVKPIEILLVEDNPDDVELTKESLKGTQLQYRLSVAEDGADRQHSGALSRGDVFVDVGRADGVRHAGEEAARYPQARDDAQRMVLITGVHAATGDATAAQRRALRVRHALEADGVPPAQLVLSKPLAARAGSGAKEARRVDLQLQ